MPDFKPPAVKRIVATPTPTLDVQVSRFDPAPNLGALLQDGLTVFQTEILKLKKKSNQIGSLSPTDANVLQGYMKTLTQMAKEVRERDKEAAEQTSNLSDAELIAALESELEAAKSRVGAK